MNPVVGHRLLNGIVAAVSLSLALVLVEIALRHTDLIPETDQSNANLVYDRSWPDYYKLKPNLHGVPFTGIALSSNEFGFRDRGMTLPRRAGVERIAVMGDSWAFGWGMEYEKTFVRRLESLLRERHPDRPVELLNFAIPGHNMNQHFAMLRDEVLRFRPDRVVLFLHLNDIEVIPASQTEPAAKPDAAATWHLPELKTSQLVYSRVLLPVAMRLGISNPKYVNDLLSQYSPEGRYLESYVRYVDGYLDLLRHAGVDVTVFLLPLALAQNHPYQLQVVNDRVKAIFADRGVEVIELLESYTSHRKDELIIHANDYHPNEFACGLLAEEILGRFEEGKLLD
jgi:GDSL-like Lipase/Acylhydrolase family